MSQISLAQRRYLTGSAFQTWPDRCQSRCEVVPLGRAFPHVLVSRIRHTMRLGCTVDLPEEENQADDERKRCTGEQAPNEPIQWNSKHDFKKERSDHRPHKDGRN